MTNERLLRGIVLKIVYPFFMLVGAFVRKRKEHLQNVIIRLNNRLVRKEAINVRKMLLLLPHCLQVDKCKIRITHNIRNCKQCGKCGIKSFIDIADRNGLELFVATGGSLARRILSDIRPDAVVAVACERDLSSGIADSYPLPVLGITNERPFGPCINTRVDMKKVEEAIEQLCGRPTEGRLG
jgi:hypothetical protein